MSERVGVGSPVLEIVPMGSDGGSMDPDMGRVAGAVMERMFPAPATGHPEPGISGQQSGMAQTAQGEIDRHEAGARRLHRGTEGRLSTVKRLGVAVVMPLALLAAEGECGGNSGSQGGTREEPAEQDNGGGGGDFFATIVPATMRRTNWMPG